MFPCSGWQRSNGDNLPCAYSMLELEVDDVHNIYQNDENKETPQINDIRAMLRSIGDGEINISAYDTAWVALVKKMDGDHGPQFPSSINWIIQNQLPDGSWGDQAFFLVHDRMINTLACVIALKSWNIHKDKWEKGLSFIRENLWRLEDNELDDWMLGGFEITFPQLLDMAIDLGLDVPCDDPALQAIFAKRDLKLARFPKDLLHNEPTTLLFSIEGMKGLDWKRLLKLQCPDGSIMSCPAPTAYALMKTGDKKCLEFLDGVINKFKGGGVFKNFEKDGKFYCFAGEANQSVTAMFSLYRASQVAFPGEDDLQWSETYSREFLVNRRASNNLKDKWLIPKDLPGEIGYALDLPWRASLPRIETRMYLEQYGGSGDVWIAKVLYRMFLISNDLLLEAAKADFGNFQRLCRLELHGLQEWCNRNNLAVSPKSVLQAYFLAAASIFEPDRATERLGWARTAVLADAVSSHLRGSASTDSTREGFIAKLTGDRRNNTQRGAKDATKSSLLNALHEHISLLAFDDASANNLCETWKQWLMAWTSKDCEGNAALLIARTVEICSGRHPCLQEADLSRLEHLTSSICRKLGNHSAQSRETEAPEVLRREHRRLPYHRGRSRSTQPLPARTPPRPPGGKHRRRPCVRGSLAASCGDAAASVLVRRAAALSS
ncbi:hypothetical protein QYE76_003908 [Lolium multiflorum]|uniref:Uncharacterized protein n=1 Tax=Lolium multiflorum TaxID=4521 RepID=A0AAD8RPM5_LOLMU|nr:hypothetical protein QYE76_003908 [Lolium multiflorum]